LTWCRRVERRVEMGVKWAPTMWVLIGGWRMKFDFFAFFSSNGKKIAISTAS
jgi:hypothetical protein